jgi:signal transduction histidine kinase
MKAKILYAEDNPESRTLVRRILEASGYVVIEAEDGLSALRRAQEELPDLILMDINIPGMDGFEVTTRLRTIPALRNVPIVALTASAVMEGDRERTLAAGCDGYLQKPVDVDRLPTQIQEFIDGKRETIAEGEEPLYLREYSQKLVARLEEKIAELEQVNEQLQTLDRLKSEFISTVSHELRTPLTSIKGFVHLLLEQRPGPLTPEQKESLLVVRDNTEQVIRRVNDILFLQETNLIVPARAPVSLGEIVLQVVDSIRERASDAGIQVDLLIPETLPQIWGDYEALKLLFLHLLDNAIKFSPRGGTITVQIGENESELLAEVSDTGVGIAPEHHEAIFQRFFQVDSSTTRAFGGAGLGLTISKRIVEAHRGHIGVRSERKRGATFFFSLPKKGPAGPG